MRKPLPLPYKKNGSTPSIFPNTSNSVNLKERIRGALDMMILLHNAQPETMLDIFNDWLRDQDARNSDGDELRIDP